MAAPLSAALITALRELAGAETLLVALDFDGTLAPEVDEPEQARALPEARAAVLRMLGLPNTPVALVSGRAIASLAAVSDLPETVLLVGSHGIEFRLEDPSLVLGLTEDEIARVAQLGEVLGRVADTFDQVWLERKPAGFALHTRRASDADSAAAERDALAATEAAFTGLTVRRGKNVIEFSVRSTTKGDAIETLREHTGATAVLYAGDDVTDEDVFAILGTGDLGLKSGHGTTVAAYRVAGPQDVAEALHLLAELRAVAAPRP